MFVVIEGVDAAGKQTQSKAIRDKLISLGRYHAELYSFPRYQTPVGQIILDILKGAVSLMRESTRDSSDIRIDGDTIYRREEAAEAVALQALMTADKLDTAVEIRELLRRNHDIVCDRWTPSAECYGAADGLDVDWIKRIQSSLPNADFYFYIEVSEEEALRRRPKLRDRYELDRLKQQTVRQLYRETWAVNEANSPGGHWIIVDGHGTPEEVTQRIWDQIIEKRSV